LFEKIPYGNRRKRIPLDVVEAPGCTFFCSLVPGERMNGAAAVEKVNEQMKIKKRP
jgi:hypothetical protein